MKHSLFPEIEPYSTGFLDVDDTHSLYWEQSGNPDGVPVVFVHGGPGGGASPNCRRFFDPEHYRIILFDQRGAGKSQPFGCLVNNTLSDLVADMEKLRTRLNIQKWHVFGGSWGSTLSLAYAQANPSRCLSLILRGIFLCEQPEIDWFLYGMGKVFPEAYERFISAIAPEQRHDLLRPYYDRLTKDDDEDSIEAGQCWANYERACSTLLPPEPSKRKKDKLQSLAIARIEAHYFLHNVIKEEDSLLKHVDKIRHIPATIIHGRYDMICPIETAHKLHKAWPEADYIIVPDAGHSSTDPALLDRLLEAVEHAKTIC